MKKTLLAAKDISKEFGKDRGAVPVLDHVSVDIYEDDFTIIMGPSGAGKSTLLYVLSGMDRVSSGTVVYKGKVISRFKESQMAKIRSREFGFVFQQTLLVSNLTLFENVTVAGYLGKERKPEETRKQAEALLEQMNVGSAKDRMPAEVSGGEAQRAAIARALSVEPEFIVADEPISSLDISIQAQIMHLFKKLQEEHHLTIMLIAHDLPMVMHVSDRIIMMGQEK